mgnify:CR=1 FL=1
MYAYIFGFEERFPSSKNAKNKSVRMFAIMTASLSIENTFDKDTCMQSQTIPINKYA